MITGIRAVRSPESLSGLPSRRSPRGPHTRAVPARSKAACGSAPRRRRRGCVLLALALEELRHARAELGHREWLGQMAGGPVTEALFDLFALDRRRHEHDRNMRERGSRMHRIGHPEAIHLGHHDVAEDYVRTDLVYQRETSLPVLGHVYLVARRAKRGAHELLDHRIVLAEDDLAHDAAAATPVPAAARGKVT